MQRKIGRLRKTGRPKRLWMTSESLQQALAPRQWANVESPGQLVCISGTYISCSLVITIREILERHQQALRIRYRTSDLHELRGQQTCESA